MEQQGIEVNSYQYGFRQKDLLVVVDVTDKITLNNVEWRKKIHAVNQKKIDKRFVAGLAIAYY